MTAQDELTFNVEGDARIVAVSNGDITSDEAMTGNRRRLYNGSAMVILRAGKYAGKITLRTSSDAYKTAVTVCRYNNKADKRNNK